ncbi:MAG: alpha/beta fold hydrolase [Spirochaetales bacterium]|nr:alpha/beta fold hydrolase [Spirochaetales bacterium]
MNLPILPPLEDLVTWLNVREEPLGVRPGCEKVIIWPQGRPRRAPLAIVYIHGYSGTRRDISPTVETLAHDLQAPVFFTRLAGHGLIHDPHRGVKLFDWKQDLKEALAIGHALGEKVIVIGTSAGATLALWSALEGLAADALILTSPLLVARQSGAFLLQMPLLKYLVKALLGPWMSFPPQNTLQAEIWDCKHRTDSLIPLLALAQKVRQTSPRHLQTPVLSFISPQDKVASAPAALHYLKQIPSHYLNVVELLPSHDQDYHVLTGEALSPGTTTFWLDTTLNFLRQRNLVPSR